MSPALLMGWILMNASPVVDAGCVAGQQVEVEALLEGARERNRKYDEPTPEALAATLRLAQALVVDTSAGQITAQTLELARQTPFELVPTHLGRSPAVGVIERAGRRAGGGVYVFKCGTPGPLIVQTPHSFYDEGTLGIGLVLAAHPSARALFVNTVHRYGGAPPPRKGGDESDGAGKADLAHQAAAHFQCFTEALASPTAVVLQVHGFASVSGLPEAQVVLSDGSEKPPPPLDSLAGRVKTWLKGKSHVLVYPRDVRRLGATTNVQGKLVREKGGRFVHVELSRTLRDRLISDAAALGEFAEVLASATDP